MAADEGVVDFDYLETFAAGDMRVVAEVLELFLEQALIWQAGLAQPGDGWRDVVHTIKGASRGVGAVALGDICERAEREGPGSLSGVRAGIDAAVAAVEGYLARLGGG